MLQSLCVAESIADTVKGNINIWRFHNMIKSRNIFDLIYKQLPNDAVFAFTDGASRNNPGNAGAAAIVKFGKNGKWYKVLQFLGRGTNNQAEIYAIWLVLKGLYLHYSVHHYRKNLFIFTDSALVVSIFSQFRIYRKNACLIGWFYNEIKYLLQHGWDIKFYNVKGHVDIIYNNKVDKLAVEASTGTSDPIYRFGERPFYPIRPFK